MEPRETFMMGRQWI